MISEVGKAIHLASLFRIRKLNYTVCVRNFQKMVTSKKFVLAKQFDGPPKESDLEIVEEELPPIKDGGKYLVNNKNNNTCCFCFCFSEFLAKAVYLSVDPYMRAYAYKLPSGATMVGTQVAE